MSEQDERDAEAYANGKRLDPMQATEWNCLRKGFLAGRKGMVPASERGKAFFSNDNHVDQLIAEAVNAERERCAMICNSFMGWGEPAFKIKEQIINPPSEMGGENEMP